MFILKETKFMATELCVFDPLWYSIVYNAFPA